MRENSPASSRSWLAASRWWLSSRLLASNRTTTCQNSRRPLPGPTRVRQRVFDTLRPSTWRRSTPAPGLRAHRQGRGCRRAETARHPAQRRPNLRPGSHLHLRLRRPPRPRLPRLRARQCRPRCRRKTPRRPRRRRRGHRRLCRYRRRREWIERHHAGALAASTGQEAEPAQDWTGRNVYAAVTMGDDAEHGGSGSTRRRRRRGPTRAPEPPPASFSAPATTPPARGASWQPST